MTTHLSSQTVYTLRDEFLTKYPRKYVDDIPDGIQKLVCVLLGTIKDIQEEYGWYYIACCKCNKKVVSKSQSLKDIDVTDNEGGDKLYIYDNENEVENKKNAIRSGRNQTGSHNDSVDPQVINDIKNLMDICNPLVITYMMARDRFIENNQQNVKLKLIGRREKDERTYNLPSASKVAGIVIDDIDASFDKRDIVVETQSGQLRTTYK
nr:hypothetical protein [Tanacetum cinerariifolium]